MLVSQWLMLIDSSGFRYNQWLVVVSSGFSIVIAGFPVVSV